MSVLVIHTYIFFFSKEAFQYLNWFIDLIASSNDILSFTYYFVLCSSQAGIGVTGISPFRNSSKYSCHLDAFIRGSNYILLFLSLMASNVGLIFWYIFYCCKEISDSALCVILLCVM